MAEQKKYGDKVIVVIAGVELNALVANSSFDSEGSEHVTAVYLDPAKASPVLGGTAVDSAIGKVISIPPFVEGLGRGWKEEVNPLEAQLAVQDAKVLELQKQLVAEEPETLDEAALQPNP